jgi:AcrR family transcriptional regulator
MSDVDASTVGGTDPDRREGARPECRASHSGRAPLSRNRIVDAAMCYVDANCLDDLSMRRLGGELGVEAMSLYRYFPSKAALLDGVVCHALDSLELPASDVGGDSWEQDVRAFARSSRRLAREHPRLMPLLATMGPQNHTLAGVTNRMVGLWRDAGLDQATAQRAQAALQNYITGSSLWDAAAERSDDDFEFGLDAMVAGLRGVVAGDRG